MTVPTAVMNLSMDIYVSGFGTLINSAKIRVLGDSWSCCSHSNIQGSKALASLEVNMQKRRLIPMLREDYVPLLAMERQRTKSCQIQHYRQVHQRVANTENPVLAPQNCSLSLGASGKFLGESPALCIHKYNKTVCISALLCWGGVKTAQQ